MPETFFISDTHFGHKKILQFEPLRASFASCIEEHDEKLIDNWNKTVNKKDVVYHLGDVAWGSVVLEQCARLVGDKRLVMGNHDHYPTEKYLQYFSKVYGVATLKTGEVLSHIPLHIDTMERWGKTYMDTCIVKK
jgi:calcineurin-like phosphoesterase family protein